MSGSQFIELFVGGLAIGCIYSLIALGFTMIIRATGVLHFAQGEVVMLGAMFGVTAHHLLPLPFIALLLVGMVFGGIAAVAIELGVYRTLRVRRVPLMNIIIATVGMWPTIVMYVYYGKVVGDVAALAAGVAPERGPEYYVLLVVGLVATIVATTMVTRAAKKAMTV